MSVSISQMFRVFGRIGVLSFGGPAAQISLMQTELVDRHKWLSEQQFLQALSFCMLLPGPEAMQLATYAGWRLRGVVGGLIGGLLFVLPGAAVIMALGVGYAYFGGVPLVQVMFAGIKAAVVIIVFQALWKLARRALTGGLAWGLALAAFVAIFFGGLPFPLIIGGAALIGLLLARAEAPPAPAVTVSHAATLRTIAIWGAIWVTPIVVLWAIQAELLLALALFFSKLAVVTFGGAYAVLAYMTQEIVQTHGWLSTAQMIDALGLAETTPGPLILVTQFAGFMAGFLQGGPGLAVAAALVTLWVTFVPCFLWIFAAAPYVEALLARPRLKGAFEAISASVAGVILSLAAWFSLHVLFAEVTQGQFGPNIVWHSFSIVNAGLVGCAALIYLGLKVPMVAGLGLMAGTALAVDLIF